MERVEYYGPGSGNGDSEVEESKKEKKDIPVKGSESAEELMAAVLLAQDEVEAGEIVGGTK